MKFNTYAWKGRLFPAIISIIIPIIIFNHFFVSEKFRSLLGDVFYVKIIPNLTISAIILYYSAEVGRFFGKHIFERIYFESESNMPTTRLLLFKDKTFSDDYKKKIHRKIFTDFNIRLPTKSEEDSNADLARTKIVETMSLIRKKLHRNSFLLQHNIEYGAMRNLIGGAVLGVILSIFNIVFFSRYYPIDLAVHISIATLIVYLLLILFSKIIITFYGNNYAKILYREYLSSKKKA
jgi:hypothetical protein